MEDSFQQGQAELEARVRQRTAELTRANEQLTALYQVGQIITASLHLDEVLDLIARSTAQLLGTDTGVILLLDETGEYLTIKGIYGARTAEAVKNTRDRVGESIAGRVVQTGQPIIANDLPNDPRFYNPAAAKEGLLACASVPLKVGEKIIGTLDVHSRVNRQAFTEAHLQILKMLASQAAIAIEHARLYEEAGQARAELEERVQQRTAELVAANERLYQEITERKQVEEALRESESRFRQLAESLPQLVWTCEPDGPCDYLSQQWIEYTGIPADEQLGFGWLQQLHPDDREPTIAAWQAAVASGSDFQVEFRIRRHDGVYRWFDTRALRLRNREGRTVKWFGSNTDITERKRTEEALRESEQRYSAIFDKSPFAIALTKIPERTTVNVNDAFLNLFEYAREELIGKTSVDLRISEAEAQAQIAEELRAAGRVRDFECTRTTKSGARLALSLNLDWVSIEGVKYVLTTIRDITKRKQAEEALRLSEERFAKAFRASPAAISLTRLADGCFIDVNESFQHIFGYSREELIGHRSAELNMFANLEERTKAVQLLREQGSVRNYEMTMRAKSGELRQVLFSTEMIELEGEAHALAILSDITERKRAEEQLRQTAAELTRSNAELQQFAYVASHDLQEPLRMVASYTQLLARRYQGKLDAEADEFIAFAVDGANRMKRLINDLLAFSRVGTQGHPLRPTSSETVLKQVLANLQLAIAERQAIVSYDPLPTVLADETQLLQLFQNLISNALKFCDSQTPQAHISAQPKGQAWLFSIRDNGIGLDSAYAERIFIIFQRLHKREDYSGTGIGLAICKRIVERHGGRIWVESQPGQGATFYFTLPAVSQT